MMLRAIFAATVRPERSWRLLDVKGGEHPLNRIHELRNIYRRIVPGRCQPFCLSLIEVLKYDLALPGAAGQERDTTR